MAYLVDSGVLRGAVDGDVMCFCAQTTQAKDPWVQGLESNREGKPVSNYQVSQWECTSEVMCQYLRYSNTFQDILYEHLRRAFLQYQRGQSGNPVQEAEDRYLCIGPMQVRLRT